MVDAATEADGCWLCAGDDPGGYGVVINGPVASEGLVARGRKVKQPSRQQGLRTFATSSFESRYHLEEDIRGADGERYRVRLARTGIHRRLVGAPINHILNDISWISYPLKKERNWTLTVVHRGEWGEKTVLEERFSSREDGAVRAEGLIELVLSNLDYGTRLRTAAE
jgi:hypothetical protein